MSEPTVTCTACRGQRSDDFGDECKECKGTGAVLACVECLAMPQEPIWAPTCSSLCREAWQRRQPAPIARKAP